MARLEVSVTELQNAANKIDQYTADYETAANSLRTAADALAGTWTGDSQVAFVTEQNLAFEWYQKMAGICREYAEAMRQAAQRYMDADTEATGTIKAV